MVSECMAPSMFANILHVMHLRYMKTNVIISPPHPQQLVLIWHYNSLRNTCILSNIYRDGVHISISYEFDIDLSVTFLTFQTRSWPLCQCDYPLRNTWMLLKLNLRTFCTLASHVSLILTML